MAIKGSKKQQQNDDFTFEIVESLGVLSTNPKTNWTLECNVVAWNGREPKIDIRSWDPEHAHMAKGVTLTEKEALALCDMIKNAIE